MYRSLAILLAGVLALPLAGASCSQSPTDPEPSDLAILFIGNSLTYYNDLPDILEDLLAEADVGDTFVEMIAEPNYGLEDHWNRLETVARITDHPWDVVVMQQGPSATEGRPSLLEFSKLFADKIREAGAVPALYMVWPDRSRLGDFRGVRESYRAAADSVDGYFFPSGAAWQEAWAINSDLDLYGPDQFHPTAEGSYLAAVVMYEQLTGKRAPDLNRRIGTEYGPVALTPLVGQTLHDAARAANLKYARPMPVLIED